MEVVWLLKVDSRIVSSRPVLLSGAGGHWKETYGFAGCK